MLYPKNATQSGLTAGPDAPPPGGAGGVFEGYNASVIRPASGAQASGILVLADGLGWKGDAAWRARR